MQNELEQAQEEIEKLTGGRVKMRQERFTEQAQEALQASQQMAMQYKHSQWDVEHILLALLIQRQGLVGEILKELNVDIDDTRNGWKKPWKGHPRSPTRRGKFMPRRVSPG